MHTAKDVSSVVADLGHNYNPLTGEVELFDGFAEYNLRGAIRIRLPVSRSIVHSRPSECGDGKGGNSQKQMD